MYNKERAKTRTTLRALSPIMIQTNWYASYSRLTMPIRKMIGSNRLIKCFKVSFCLILRKQLTQYVHCVFYSGELSGPIFTKIAQKLAFESTKRSPCSDFQFSIFRSRYSHFTPTLITKLDVKRPYLEPKKENWKSEQGDLLVDSKASFCAIFMKIAPLSFSE